MQHLNKVIWIQGFIDFSVSAYFIFITWYLYAETENVLYTGLFVGLGFLPSFLCNLYFGVLVDRHNKKWILSIALTIMIASMITFFATINQVIPVLLILTHMIVQLCGSLIRPAIQAYVANLFSREQFLTVFSKSASYTIMGGILGTSISSLLVAKSYIVGLTLIILIPLVISLYLLWNLPKEKKEMKYQKSSIFKEITSGFTYCFSNIYFIQLLILMALGQLIYHTTIGFLAAFTFDVLQSNATIYGMLEIIISIGGILAGLLSVRLVKLLKRFFPIVATCLLTVSLLVLTLRPSIVLTALSCLGIGYCTTWIRTNFQAIQQMSTHEEYHGRVASIRMFFNQGFIVCLTPVLGLLAQKNTIHIIFVFLACISMIGIIISIILTRNNQFKNMDII